MTAQKETLGFQAEVKQLLNLMIHSLYSNKEIFLRELISNASDAADKLRFEALDRQRAATRTIPISRSGSSFDKAARTITVSDNGIGMSREEVIENIGTIAKSGTREFFEKLTGDQAKDAHLIGQFGVGFYSSFIVADRVTLRHAPRRPAAEQGVRWESDWRRASTPSRPCDKAERGTEVILHLREGEDELSPGASAARASSASTRTTSRADRDEEGGVGQGQERVSHHRRGRDRQPGGRAVGAAEERDHRGAVPASSTSTSPTTSRRRSPGRTTGSKAARNTRSSSTSRRARRSTSGTATSGAASSSTCGVSSSWTTPST